MQFIQLGGSALALHILPRVETQGRMEIKSGASSLQKRLGRRFYRAAYYTGEKAQTLACDLTRAARSVFHVALSEAFRGAGDLVRDLSELNRSRLGRGELSLTRGLIEAGAGAADTIRVCREAFFRDGILSGLAVAGDSIRRTAARFFVQKRSLFNFVAPVASIFVLACTVYFWSHATLALQVANEGKALGVVASESVYRDAASQVEQNVSDASGSGFKLDGKVSFHLVLASASDLSDETQIYDNIVMKSCSGVRSGYGLYVDNRLVGANSGGGVIEAMLDGITEKYKKDPKVQSVGFVQDVSVKSGVFPSSVFKSETAIKDIVTAKNPAAGAKSGKVTAEKPAGIFRISLDPLYVMNLSTDTPADQVDQINQDEPIVSSSSDPTLTVKLVKNEVFAQPVAHKVVQIKTARLKRGVKMLQVKGKNGSKRVVASVTYEGGQKTDVDVISSTLTKKPVTEKILIGTAKPVPTYSPSDSSAADSANSSGSAPSYDASGSSSVTRLATSALGVPYVPGGSSYSGFDCSGFTMYVYSKLGVYLPHSAAGQSAYGNYVSRSSLRTGDLVFFDTNGGHNSISHVGIYLGGGSFIDASSARPHCIKVDSLYSSYYANRFMTARRVLK
jgi:Cell wall-associated hydrolases (invasion-associated proteins)